MGILAVDLAHPLFVIVHLHDSKGMAIFSLDLRRVPSGAAGLHFGIQTLALDPSNAFLLSSPWIGIVGR